MCSDNMSEDQTLVVEITYVPLLRNNLLKKTHFITALRFSRILPRTGTLHGSTFGDPHTDCMNFSLIENGETRVHQDTVQNLKRPKQVFYSVLAAIY